MGAVHGGDVAVGIGVGIGAGHQVGGAQTHFTSRCESEVLRRWVQAEVILFNPQLTTEGHRSGTGGRVLGVVHNVNGVDVAVWPVGDHESQRS